MPSGVGRRGHVCFRGAADKVDQPRDGTLLVTDIKTGGRQVVQGSARGDPVAGGEKLQLPVYAHGGPRRLTATTTSRSGRCYWFVRRDRSALGVDLTAESRSAIATRSAPCASIAAGLLPAAAPEAADFPWVQCAYCNPDGLGHGGSAERWERQSGSTSRCERARRPGRARTPSEEAPHDGSTTDEAADGRRRPGADPRRPRDRRCSSTPAPGRARPRRSSPGSAPSCSRRRPHRARSRPSRSPRRPPPSCATGCARTFEQRRAMTRTRALRSGSAPRRRSTSSTSRRSARCTPSRSASSPSTRSRPASRRSSRCSTRSARRSRSRTAGRRSAPTARRRRDRRHPGAGARRGDHPRAPALAGAELQRRLGPRRERTSLDPAPPAPHACPTRRRSSPRRAVVARPTARTARRPTTTCCYPVAARSWPTWVPSISRTCPGSTQLELLQRRRAQVSTYGQQGQLAAGTSRRRAGRAARPGRRPPPRSRRPCRRHAALGWRAGGASGCWRPRRSGAPTGELEFHDLLVLARDLLRDNADVRATPAAALPAAAARRVPGHRPDPDRARRAHRRWRPAAGAGAAGRTSTSRPARSSSSATRSSRSTGSGGPTSRMYLRAQAGPRRDGHA